MTAAEILLEQARSQLARQEVKLTAFRATAGTVLAAGGVVAGLLAKNLTSSMSTPGIALASVAVGVFLSGVVASVSVLAPSDGYNFAEGLDSYKAWLDEAPEGEDTDSATALGLAMNLDAARRNNEAKLDTAAKRLSACCVLLSVQVALWVSALLVG